MFLLFRRFLGDLKRSAEENVDILKTLKNLMFFNVFGLSWAPLGPILGPFGGVLGGSWGVLGGFLEGSWGVLGGSREGPGGVLGGLFGDVKIGLR